MTMRRTCGSGRSKRRLVKWAYGSGMIILLYTIIRRIAYGTYPDDVTTKL